MILGKIRVCGVVAKPVSVNPIPRGIVTGQLQFEYDPLWESLAKTVVFRAGNVTKDILNPGELVTIPPEVVAEAGRILRVGVWGEGTPTLWTDLGRVRDAADPSGDESTDPTLPVWAQLQEDVEKLKQNSPGGPGEDGGHYVPAVTQPDDNTLEFSFTPSKADMPAVEPVQVELPAGQGNGGNVDYVGVEPAEDDIPKIFFGGALQQTKDEAVVPFRYISKTEDFSGYAEIKAQGNSSMSYPKKNQTVKMFKDAECAEKMKVDFKGWGKQNKHVYKANWIDLSHARNVVSARLWADVVKSRANYADLPELFRTTPNQGAVDGFPVKVYADGVYQGRYTLNIPKDKWTFNMDDELDEHCVLCGENYSSGCFRATASINGSDWTDEIHDTVPASIKTRWNEVISFVMNSTDDEFRANLSQYFYVDSLIDYYLFGLVSCGLDAFGKNQIYATYDGQRWIASMYDMDSTWGLYWNGSKFVATDYARTSYEDYVSTSASGEGNLLYNRLEQLFYEELQTRWAELKNGALSIENIINRFERFTDIAPAELVKEDYASTTGGGKFTGIPSQTTNNIQQIRSFALARQAWTDEYVANLTASEPEEPDEPETPDTGITCTGITLDKSELTFTGEGTQTITATVSPADTTDTVVWVSSAPAVASITVEGNVCTVQSVSNGNAVITVTCGDYSANCSVAVSGIADTSLLYSLAEETVFDGSSTYIDTGVQLFDTSKDFTVFIDFTAGANKTNQDTLFSAMYEVSPYPGLVVKHDMNGLHKVCTGGTQLNISMNCLDNRMKLAIVYSAESKKFQIHASDDSNYEFLSDSAVVGTFDQNVLIGCYQTNSGTKGRYWTGTVHACEIFNRMLSNDEIASKTGAQCLTVDDITWNANSKVDSTGSVVSGNNYVSGSIELPEDTSVVIYGNSDAGTFVWLGIWQYDENMNYIKGSENGSGTDDYILNIEPNTKYVRLSGYNAASDADPASQLKLQCLIIT